MPVTNLPFIQQQMVRYGMTTYLVLGLLGNICNCIMFTNHSQRRTASSIYFLTLSIFGIIYLVWALTPMLYTLDHIDPQKQSVFYCKVRLYGSHVCGQWIRYIIVCACADRFFATQTDVRLRSLSSVSVAAKLIFSLCLLWLIIPIHGPILMDIRGGVCGMFDIYKLIYSIYQIIVVGIVPLILMCVFSILTIRNLRQRDATQVHIRKRDRYLMRIVIGEVGVIIFTTIPYSVNLIYGAATYYVVNKSTERLEIESFITFVTQFIIYLISVAPFYLFIITLKSFRNEFIKIFMKYLKKYILRQVQVAPFNENNNATTMNNRTMLKRQ